MGAVAGNRAALGLALILATAASGCAKEPNPARALIVDQLSQTDPNPDFVAKATNLLVAAGYDVEYVAGNDVTVDFFRELPSHDPDILILRVHSARREVTAGLYTNSVDLFTGEMIDLSRYELDLPPAVATSVTEARRAKPPEQPSHVSNLSGSDFKYVSPVFYRPQGQELPHFAIQPAFLEQVMQGTLLGTTVILMGCEGMLSRDLAKKFVKRGAARVIGWDKKVSATYTDVATLALLRHLLTKPTTAREAMSSTTGELGPDPDFGARLTLFPEP